MARLILNADDFGYTAGINKTVLALHRSGVLTSTTMMAKGLAVEDGLRRLGELELERLARTRYGKPGFTAPGLPAEIGTELSTIIAENAAPGVGCHVVLVDGSPAAPPALVPSLLARPLELRRFEVEKVEEVEKDGDARINKEAARSEPALRANLGQFVADLMRGRILEADIEREAVAQIRLLQQAGLLLTHIDTHKHTHMFPGVLRPLLRAAVQCNIRAIRNPFEPAWSRAATMRAPLVRRIEVALLSNLRTTFRRLVREAGMRTTEGSIGVLATGTLDQSTLASLLDAAKREAERLAGPERGRRGRTDPAVGLNEDWEQGLEPVWELVCHPGFDDPDLATLPTRLRKAREIESRALGGAAELLQPFRLVNFGDLA